MKWIVADFETLANNTEYTYVWGWGYYDIEVDFFDYGSNIETFFNSFLHNYKFEKEIDIYFHNLKFDGSFILNFLIKKGYTEQEDRVKRGSGKKYSTLISSLGQWYSIELFYKGLKVRFLNSLNLLPTSVARLSKSLALETKKGEIDYNLYRDENHKLTKDEIEYIYNDVFIVAKGLNEVFFKRGLLKMTVGSNALKYAKQITKGYDNLFPVLSEQEHKFIKKAYRGGYTNIKGGKTLEYVGEGCVFDYNSMYPSMMMMKPLPIGKPYIYHCSSIDDLERIADKLYVISFYCTFKIKDNGLPTFLNKNPLIGKEGEYLTESDIISKVYMTNIDFEHFKRNYHINNFKISLVYFFESKVGVFSDYINYWGNEKIKGKTTGDKFKETLSKLMLNSLTGKFATSEKANRKITFSVDGILKFKEIENTKNTEYIPLTTFITAWSRHELFSVIYDNFDEFLYSDTDSVHLACKKEDAKIKNQHNSEFGNWKYEYSFKKARYVKRKCYIEVGDETVIRCSGLSEKYHHLLDFDNFKQGTEISVLKGKQIVGGQILCPTTFKI